MALSNTAVPIYYGQFRDAVIRGETPVNREIAMEMSRIDDLIAIMMMMQLRDSLHIARMNSL